MSNLELRAYFNALSKTYSINEYASFYITSLMRKLLIGKIQSFQNKDLLDIMSGRGENLKFLPKQKDYKITTIDFASRMNDKARRKFKNKAITQIEKDFFKVNDRANSFDIILCSFGIKTIENEKLSLFSKKINQLLKPNGEVLLLEMVKPNRSFIFKIMKCYLEKVVPSFLGSQFNVLFPFIDRHESMKSLKTKMMSQNLQIIEHSRYLDFFEIIHAKKTDSHF